MQIFILVLSLIVPGLTYAQEALSLYECSHTHITRINYYFQDQPESGSLVEFANGRRQSSYNVIPEIQRESQAGDPIFMCLIYLPTGCPENDTRGAVFTTTNLRTQKSWTLEESRHTCGGA